MKLIHKQVKEHKVPQNTSGVLENISEMSYNYCGCKTI